MNVLKTQQKQFWYSLYARKARNATYEKRTKRTQRIRNVVKCQLESKINVI